MKDGTRLVVCIREEPIRGHVTTQNGVAVGLCPRQFLFFHEENFEASEKATDFPTILTDDFDR